LKAIPEVTLDYSLEKENLSEKAEENRKLEVFIREIERRKKRLNPSAFKSKEKQKVS